MSPCWNHNESFAGIAIPIKLVFVNVQSRNGAPRGIDDIDAFQHARLYTPFHKNSSSIRAFLPRRKIPSRQRTKRVIVNS